MPKAEAPAPPDYRAAAEQTAASGQAAVNDQTAANRPDQINAQGGALRWTQGPDGQWTQTETVGGVGQAALGAAGAAAGRLGQYGQDLDWSQFGAMAGGPQAGPGSVANDETRQRVEDALYGRSTARLDSQFKDQEQSTRDRLYAQGLREGDPAFDRQIKNFNDTKESAYAGARQDAIGGGGVEQQRLQGMDLANQAQTFSQGQSAAGFSNQNRSQSINEALQRRQMPMQEISSLFGLTGNNFQGFNAAGQGPGTNYTGAAQNTYQGQQDQYSANNAWKQQLMQGLFSLGGAGLKFI